MKRFIKCTVAIFLFAVLVVGSVIPSLASTQPTSYSKSANSGQRDVVCTTLEGTSASEYYTGDYTYGNLSVLPSSSLLSALRTLMTETHTHQTVYSDCRDNAVITDCENANGNSIITLYTSYETSRADYNNGSGWNREHVWPKSLGGFNQEAAGADLHHIRPTENRTNSQRGNKKYGNVSSGNNSTGNMSGLVGGTRGTYFEPLDNVKGDVARICLYVYVRWGGQYSKCSSITNVFESVDVLLEWCELDPVDTWEMGRNEVVQNIQGNRNVFIDYPELAWTLFDREVPADMVTPSGSAMACTHENTIITGAIPGCTGNGYSGDTVCANCGEVLIVGTTLPASEHSFGEPEVVVAATTENKGISKRVCKDCDFEELDFIPKLEPEDSTDANPDQDNDSTPQPDQATQGCGATVSISLIGLVTAIAAGFVLSKKKR